MNVVPARQLFLVVIACSLFVACVPETARPPEVESRIAEFLSAIRDEADGFGWHHLRDDVRASYPGGRAAWVQAIGAGDTSRLTWRIADVSVDDFMGCATVHFEDSTEHVPVALFDDELPPPARVLTHVGGGAFFTCATTGPFPFDAGVVGVG